MPQHQCDWSVYIINLWDCREVADCDFALDVEIQKIIAFVLDGVFPRLA